MRKIDHPLIVSDFDGTLACDNVCVTKENQEAIARYIKDGGKFALSTGRMPTGILHYAKALGLRGPICCCQGAVIVDIETGRPLLEGVLSNETTVTVLKKMEELDLHIHIYDNTNFYSNKDNEFLRHYERATQCKATVITDRPLSKFAEETGFCSYKVFAMVDSCDSDRVYRKIKDLNLAGVEVTRSSESNVEVVNQNYSKGTAVAFLANYYGVPLERVVAVGDQNNDLPMIETAGIGIAVKNAAPELKERAIVCEYTNEENAIAKIIEKYGYTED